MSPVRPQDAPADKAVPFAYLALRASIPQTLIGARALCLTWSCRSAEVYCRFRRCWYSFRRATWGNQNEFTCPHAQDVANALVPIYGVTLMFFAGFLIRHDEMPPWCVGMRALVWGSQS